MSLTFKANGFQGVPVDVPFRLSDFLERGRPRPPLATLGYKAQLLRSKCNFAMQIAVKSTLAVGYRLNDIMRVATQRLASSLVRRITEFAQPQSSLDLVDHAQSTN